MVARQHVTVPMLSYVVRYQDFLASAITYGLTQAER